MSLVDFIGFLLDLIAWSKRKRNVANITQEEWFEERFNDIRYSDSVWKNVRIRRIVRKTDIVEVLRSIPEEREKFIRIVKEVKEKESK